MSVQIDAAKSASFGVVEQRRKSHAEIDRRLRAEGRRRRLRRRAACSFRSAPSPRWRSARGAREAARSAESRCRRRRRGSASPTPPRCRPGARCARRCSAARWRYAPPTSTGSTPDSGRAPCEPLPSTSMSKNAPPAIIGPARTAKLAERQARAVVHAEHRLAGEALEQAVVDHRPGAADAFLGGLEDEVHRAVEAAASRRGTSPRRAASWCGRRGRRRASRPAWVERVREACSLPRSAARPCPRAGRSCACALPARSTPTTPVLPMPRCTSMPNCFSFAATKSEVRFSSKPSSGWAWMSRRQAVISPASASISRSSAIRRLRTGPPRPCRRRCTS